MTKLFFAILIVVLLAELSLYIAGLFLSSTGLIIENRGAGPASLIQHSSEGESDVTLMFVGDIMLDRGVAYKVNKEGRGDFKFPFLLIAQELQKADLLFGNLESPISNKGAKVGSIYSFRAKPEAVEGLKYAGFDILSLANNHMFDYQRMALEDTMDILKENGIDYVGAGFDQAEAFSVKLKEIKGTRTGFLAYTNLGPVTWRATADTPGIARIDESSLEEIKADIANIKRVVDILVISLHVGEEYSSKPTPFQRSFARACIEAGADLAVGHHSHVGQEVGQYQNGWIAYSLGNFVFDQGFSDQTMKGVLLKVLIKDKKIKAVMPQEVQLNEHFQPALVEN